MPSSPVSVTTCLQLHKRSMALGQELHYPSCTWPHPSKSPFPHTTALPAPTEARSSQQSFCSSRAHGLLTEPGKRQIRTQEVQEWHTVLLISSHVAPNCCPEATLSSRIYAFLSPSESRIRAYSIPHSIK